MQNERFENSPWSGYWHRIFSVRQEPVVMSYVEAYCLLKHTQRQWSIKHMRSLLIWHSMAYFGLCDALLFGAWALDSRRSFWIPKWSLWGPWLCGLAQQVMRRTATRKGQKFCKKNIYIYFLSVMWYAMICCVLMLHDAVTKLGPSTWALMTEHFKLDVLTISGTTTSSAEMLQF